MKIAHKIVKGFLVFNRWFDNNLSWFFTNGNKN